MKSTRDDQALRNCLAWNPNCTGLSHEGFFRNRVSGTNKCENFPHLFNSNINLSIMGSGLSKLLGDEGQQLDVLKCYTPRQRRLHASLDLDDDLVDSVVKDFFSINEPCFKKIDQENQRLLIKRYFKNFVLELTRGAYFKHLATGNCYLSLHCQLAEVLDMLIIDPKTGEKIEFPLLEVVRIYVLVRYSSARDGSTPESTIKDEFPESEKFQDINALLDDKEYLVVFQFPIRRLAFVFKNEAEAHRFKAFFSLLIRYLRQREEKKKTSVMKKGLLCIWKNFSYTRSVFHLCVQSSSPLCFCYNSTAQRKS